MTDFSVSERELATWLSDLFDEHMNQDMAFMYGEERTSKAWCLLARELQKEMNKPVLYVRVCPNCRKIIHFRSDKDVVSVAPERGKEEEK